MLVVIVGVLLDPLHVRRYCRCSIGPTPCSSLLQVFYWTHSMLVISVGVLLDPLHVRRYCRCSIGPTPCSSLL